MKRYFILTVLLFSVCIADAQKQKVDSLTALLAKEKADSNSVRYMWQMASYLYSYAPDSALRIAQKAWFLSTKIKYVEGESRALGQMANGFLSLGNYPRALEFYLKKLKIEEGRRNPYNLASATMNIGIVYVYEEEYEKALNYLRRADSLITANKIEDLQYNIKLNIGDVYNRKDMNDSAFLYFNEALRIAKQTGDGDFTGIAMVGLGHTYLKAKNYTGSLQAYKGALQFLEAATDEDMMCEASLGLAKLYKALANYDSATYFARASFLMAKKDGFQSRQLEAANFLSDAYSSMQANNDSAFVYLRQANIISDSINSKTKIRETQMLTINEQLRQDEIAENARKLKEERAQQLQLLLIGLFIPTLFIATLLLSKIKIHVKIINFLGILSLLILFEYLTLLLHPLVVEFTHHTPFFELLIFVAIASLLIPAHHRIEHWLIEKLTVRKRNYEAGNLKIKRQKLKIKKTP